MKFLAGIILFFATFFTGYTQAEKDSVPIKYIIIDSTRIKISEFKRLIKPNGDFYRQKTLIRLDLNAPGNEPLLKAHLNNESPKIGIVQLLIQGLEENKLLGLHPANLKKPFDYYDLIYQLLELEGVHPDPMGDSIRISELGWEWMMESLDLIVDEGHSNMSSQSFFRINYLRLVWENPFTARGKQIITVLPYNSQMIGFLEKIQCPLEDGSQTSINAREFLELRQFRGVRAKISEDSARPINSHIDPKQKAIFKIEEIWQP